MPENIRQLKPWQAFKNFAIIFSFITNFILVIVLGVVAVGGGPHLFPLLNDVVEPLVGGLADSFVQMGDATIVRTIQVEDEIGISFTLPLNTETDVTLTEAVPLQVPARFVLPNGGGTIQGIVNIELPAGLDLPVALNLDVPVDQQVPIALAVDVEIPLDETELGEPFATLEGLFAPLDRLVSSLPNSPQDFLDRLNAQGPPAPSSD